MLNVGWDGQGNFLGGADQRIDDCGVEKPNAGGVRGFGVV